MDIHPLFSFFDKNNATILLFKHMCKYFLTIVLDQVYVSHQICLAVISDGCCWVTFQLAWH